MTSYLHYCYNKKCQYYFVGDTAMYLYLMCDKCRAKELHKTNQQKIIKLVESHGYKLQDKEEWVYNFKRNKIDYLVFHIDKNYNIKTISFWVWNKSLEKELRQLLKQLEGENE